MEFGWLVDLLSGSALAEDSGMKVQPTLIDVGIAKKLYPNVSFAIEGADTTPIKLTEARKLANQSKYVSLKSFFEKADQFSKVVQKNSKKIDASFKEQNINALSLRAEANYTENAYRDPKRNEVFASISIRAIVIGELPISCPGLSEDDSYSFRRLVERRLVNLNSVKHDVFGMTNSHEFYVEYQDQSDSLIKIGLALSRNYAYQSGRWVKNSPTVTPEMPEFDPDGLMQTVKEKSALIAAQIPLACEEARENAHKKSDAAPEQPESVESNSDEPADAGL